MEYKRLLNCLCCNSEDLEVHLDLGSQPLANSYHGIGEVLQEFELKTMVCKNCFHLQLSIAINPDLLFKNYLYVSGTTKTLHKYFEWFADFVEEIHPGAQQSVLDIACNDGTQLDYFKALGFSTYGIDPALNLHKLSSRNHEVYCGYLDDTISSRWQNKFDVIIAQNVFAHNDNPLRFLMLCRKMLKNDGKIIIQTSQSEMIKNNEFDTIYHEHISFFNVNSMVELSKRAHVQLNDAIKTSVHGSSYVFVFGDVVKNSKRIDNILTYENWQGLMHIKTYREHAEKAKNIIGAFSSTVAEFKENGYVIIGYGAAAKGNTLLNAAKAQLDFIIDDNNLKWGLLTPGTNIPIGSIDELNKFYNRKLLLIPLAWNFYSEIIQRFEPWVSRFSEVVSFQYFPITKFHTLK